MEIKARYRLIGLFMLAVIGMGFGFVYWLENAGGLTERKTYRIRFEQTVGGLNIGAPVLFNGLRVGEVTDLKLSVEDPSLIFVTIAIAKSTPVRVDTQVGIDFQGLMGSPAVSLKGGSSNAALLSSFAVPPPLLADATAGQDLIQSGRQVLSRLDKILADNATDLHDTIANLKTFSATLAKNSGRLDTLIGGLEKTFAAPTKPPVATYDLLPPQEFPPVVHVPSKQLTVAMPTAVIALDTQKIFLLMPGGESRAIEDAQWSDSLPNLIQAKIVESFENAHFAAAVTRPLEGVTASNQLLIDLRRFGVAPAPIAKAEFEFGAKIVAENGKVLAARLFHAEAATKGDDAAADAAALNEAFGKAATDLVAWTAATVFESKPN
ncbi:MAG: ABC-type transport auxiliary lipoprotein family protein [Beijerinckiaceae bacterium]